MKRYCLNWLKCAMFMAVGISVVQPARGQLEAAAIQFRVSTMFTNNMVLQRGKPDAVWGWAKPGDTVNVRFAGQRLRATAAAGTGRWMVHLRPLAASSQPRTMIISDGSLRVSLKNVLVGEVWLVSGQSNMQYPMAGWFHRTNLASALAAAHHPTIRFYHVPMIPSMFAGREHASAPAKWRVCTPETTAGVSAVGYLFCEDLRRRLHEPVGMIESDWGGTSIEAWIPAQAYERSHQLGREKRWLKKAMASEAALRGRPAPANAKGLVNSLHGYSYHFRSKWLPDGHQNPTTLFNGMIAPLIPYAISGAVWYQGENNVLAFDHHYFPKLQALIGGWRQQWHQGNFPFFIVQIAPFNYAGAWCGPNKSDAPFEPLIWQAEERAAKELPDCGIVSTMDIGDIGNIHPADKVDVGHRLAMLALAKVYHRKVAAFSGPLYASAEFQGGKVIIHFTHTNGGLVSRDGKPLNWFFLAAENGKFYPAKAVISGKTVELSAKGVSAAARVRFAWNCVAQPNLMNGAGLPALPFQASRTARGQSGG